MLNPIRFLQKKLPARLSLLVLASVVIMFVAALAFLFRYSHLTLENESLKKADQMLAGTVTHIDNQLHEVNVATRNMAWYIEQSLNNPDALVLYTQELVQNNPTIIGCALAFEPNYYKEKGELFITYSYWADEQNKELVITHNPMTIEPNFNSSMPYVAHNRFFIPIKENTTCWIRPHAPGDTRLSATIACCTPIHDRDGRPVGVLSADISLTKLSNTILAIKPFPNSYCTVLGVQGTYLIHPDSANLYQRMASDLVEECKDPKVGDLIKSMLAGKSGLELVELEEGKASYVLYKSLNEGHWSAAMVCPKSDIFSTNLKLRYTTLTLSIIGIAAIFVFCLFFIGRQLKPLGLLAKAAQQIKRGDFSTTIPPTDRTDEIGVLQRSFSTMQSSLVRNINEMNKVSEELQQRNDELSEIKNKVEESSRLKTNLIHQIADKMIPPVKLLESVMKELSSNYEFLTAADIHSMTDSVIANAKNITSLIDKLLQYPQKKKS